MFNDSRTWVPVATKTSRSSGSRAAVAAIALLAVALAPWGCKEKQVELGPQGVPPTAPIDVKGGGVPIQTFVAFREGGTPKLYVDLKHTKDNVGIELIGPVEITYADGSQEIVYVPGGSWDCVCAEKAAVNAEVGRSLHPNQEKVDPANRKFFKPVREVCRRDVNAACAEPRAGAPDCLTEKPKTLDVPNKVTDPAKSGTSTG